MYEKLKKRLESLRESNAKAAGSAEALSDQLKGLGYDSLEEAHEARKQLDKRLSEINQELKDLLARLSDDNKE